MKQPLLEIQNLSVQAEGHTILHGLNLALFPGELCIVMGPNGSGKSTLAKVLAGHPEYQITEGKILFQGKELSSLSPWERAREGLFLAFQYPVEVPGVNNLYFLKEAVNTIRKHKKLPELESQAFLDLAKKTAQELNMEEDFLYRSLNQGFSGGEKKKNEMLQMKLLDPTLAILDETDSGLDIDALKTVSQVIQKMRSPSRAFLVITHYEKMVHYLNPDKVHVLLEGEVKKTGGKELAQLIEEKGYQAVL